MSSKKVCLLFTLFKRCKKKKFCILQILLQVLPSKTEEIMQIEQMRVPNKWNGMVPRIFENFGKW